MVKFPVGPNLVVQEWDGVQGVATQVPIETKRV